ncbi:MAG: CDP-archaeol synthase, partial [Acidimicrobiia bacterium]
IAGYFVGRAFGRRRIAPKVSPRKTVEGLVGGIVVTAALASILSTIPAYDFMDFSGAILLALVVSLFAPLGDAAESVVKRALDTKDMGSILPGHGGMLDRIDALLFVVPVGYFVFVLLDYL